MKEIVLTSGILILVIAAARLVFRGKVKQSLIYGMWLLVALRLLIPVQFGSFRFSFLTPAQPLTEAMTEIAQNPVSGPSRQEVYQNIEQLYIQQGQPVTSPAIRQAIQLQVEHTITAPTIGQVLTVIWLLGAGLMAIWFIWINLRFQQKLRRGDRELLSVQAPVTVWVTGEVSSPCLVGLLRPAIYLTPASAQNPALDHVLAHELTHYRHKDHLWAFVRCLCLCLYWFHPLVWLAAFLSKRDCELACDEGALAKLGEDERIAYGKTLLEIVSQAGGHGHLLQTATTMNESKRQLKERVNYIVKQPKVWIAAAIAMVLICGVCFGCAFSGQKPETLNPTTSTETTPFDPSQCEAPFNAESLPTHGGILLTEEQIQQVNEAFYAQTYDPRMDTLDIAYSQLTCFLTSYYRQPEDIDLYSYLRYCFEYTLADDDEWVLADEILGKAYTPWCLKFDRSTVDRHLTKYLGITTQELTRTTHDALAYLEDYDAFYLHVSDGSYPITFNCISGEICEDMAYLYSDTSILTLARKDGVWLIQSHMPTANVQHPDGIFLTPAQVQMDKTFAQVRKHLVDGSLRLKIYYTDYWTMYNTPLTIPEMISSTKSSDSITLFTIENSQLQEHKDLFDQLQAGALIQPEDIGYQNERLCYVFETPEEGAILTVALADSYINGLPVRPNPVFYDLIRPYFPEEMYYALDPLYGYPLIVTEKVYDKQEDVIFCITRENTITRADQFGISGTVLFSGTQPLHYLCEYGYFLYFTHGNEIIEYDEVSGNYRILLEQENVTGLSVSETGELQIVISGDSGETLYSYDPATGQLNPS